VKAQALKVESLSLVELASLKLVEQSLSEIGVKSIKPLCRTVFVRTLPLEEISPGGIIIPRAKWFFSGPAHLRMIKGVVLAVGPKCTVSVGNVVVFQRMNFARWMRLDDGTFAGWLKDENDLIGFSDDPCR